MKSLTRKEIFMDAISSGSEAPTPLTREEIALKNIADSSGGSSGGGVLYVNVLSGDEITLDKTYNQIKSAADSGQVVLLKQSGAVVMDEVTKFGYLVGLTTGSDGVTVVFTIDNITYKYKSTSADGVLKKDDIG